jgi:hypothetical protein
VDRAVELARAQWAEGHRRLARAGGPDERELADRLHRQVEIVTKALRRRIGGSFTLAELARIYADADRWVLEAIEEAEEESGRGGLNPASTSADAAFHLYSRGARDYRP